MLALAPAMGAKATVDDPEQGLFFIPVGSMSGGRAVRGFLLASPSVDRLEYAGHIRLEMGGRVNQLGR